eukprot:scaffold584_cov338-Pavlova_lutheri.AAC.24
MVRSGVNKDVDAATTNQEVYCNAAGFMHCQKWTCTSTYDACCSGKKADCKPHGVQHLVETRICSSMLHLTKE